MGFFKRLVHPITPIWKRDISHHNLTKMYCASKYNIYCRVDCNSLKKKECLESESTVRTPSRDPYSPCCCLFPVVPLSYNGSTEGNYSHNGLGSNNDDLYKQNLINCGA